MSILRFKDWELAVIDALGVESLERLKEIQWVRHEDRYLEKFAAETQKHLLGPGAKERSSLAYHSRRLGIGPYKQRQPPRIAELGLEVECAPAHVAAEWCRAIQARLAS